MLKYLNEVLDILAEDIAQTQVTNRRYGGQFNWQKAAKPSADQLGDGAFSRVRPDATDPHMVTKETRRRQGGESGVEDGFNAFVRYLVKNGHMDNIHFPKVYKAHRTTDRNNEHKDSFQMERLEDPLKYSQEQLTVLAETHFTDRLHEHSADEMAFVLERGVNSDSVLEKYVARDTLKEAILIIREAKKVLGFDLDLHKENIMVRRTSTGPQLVISDPFGHKSDTPKQNRVPKFEEDPGISPSDVAALMQ